MQDLLGPVIPHTCFFSSVHSLPCNVYRSNSRYFSLNREKLHSWVSSPVSAWTGQAGGLRSFLDFFIYQVHTIHSLWEHLTFALQASTQQLPCFFLHGKHRPAQSVTQIWNRGKKSHTKNLQNLKDTAVTRMKLQQKRHGCSLKKAREFFDVKLLLCESAHTCGCAHPTENNHWDAGACRCKITQLLQMGGCSATLVWLQVSKAKSIQRTCFPLLRFVSASHQAQAASPSFYLQAFEIVGSCHCNQPFWVCSL